jgi:hypothetical protein
VQRFSGKGEAASTFPLPTSPPSHHGAHDRHSRRHGHRGHFPCKRCADRGAAGLRAQAAGLRSVGTGGWMSCPLCPLAAPPLPSHTKRHARLTHKPIYSCSPRRERAHDHPRCAAAQEAGRLRRAGQLGRAGRGAQRSTSSLVSYDRFRPSNSLPFLCSSFCLRVSGSRDPRSAKAAAAREGVSAAASLGGRAELAPLDEAATRADAIILTFPSAASRSDIAA